MAEPIGQIPVEITGDYSGLQKDLQQAESIASKAGGDIADAFTSSASSGLEKFGEGVAQWIEHPLQSAQGAVSGFVESFGGIGVVAIAAGAAFAEAAHAITELVLEEGAAAEATSNLANRLNLSFEDTKKLSEMAQIAGVSIEGLSRVSMRLADALEDPAGAGKKVAAALKEMDIVASDSGDALLKLLEKLSEIPDATERINKAHEVMGRSAVQLEPLLRDYQALSAAVDELGGKLDSEAVAGLKAADDAADKLGIAWAHLKENFAATFAPAVTTAIEAFTKLLTGPPQGDLDAQMARLSLEINKLEADANSASSAFERWFQGILELKPNNAILEQKKQLLDTMEAQRDAIARSKEYNDELDRSNAAQKAASAQAKATMEDMVKAETAFHNSVVDLYNTFPDTYKQYTDKLSEGGKTATDSLKQIEGELDKAKSLSSALTGKPLADINEWIVALTKMRDTAKQFADSDAFFTAATKIELLTSKFPEQVKELSELDAGFANFFADMKKGAAEAPAALNKLDISAVTAKLLEGQKQLDTAVQKTSQDMEKAWDKWNVGADKASSKQTVITKSLIEELGGVGTAIGKAVEDNFLLRQAYETLHVAIKDTTREQVNAFEVIVKGTANSQVSLKNFEESWQHVEGALAKLSQSDLPAALKGYDDAIAKAIQLGEAEGLVLEKQMARNQAVIAHKELSGVDATAELIALEQERQSQQILIDQATNLGQAYVSLRKTFNDAFESLEKGLTDAILNGKNLGEVFVNVAKQIASSILDTIIKGALKPLQDELNKTGGLFDTLSKNITKAIGGIGSFKSASAGIGSGEAPQGSGLPGGTNQVGSDVGSGEVSGSPSSGKSSGSSGAGSGLSNALGIASLGVDIASGIVQGIQGAHLNSLMDKVEKSTRGTLNQLISIQDSLNTYLPQLPHLVDIWAEIMVTNDILRLMGQNGGGLGGGSNNGADPDFAQHLADAINNNPSNSAVDTSMQDLAVSLDAGVQAANDYNAALETTASTAYSLDSAVSSTTDSLMALNDATKQVNGALPGFTDGMDRAVFNSMTQPGQNLSPGGARMNATPYIMPVPVPEGLTGPQGVTQGAMLQHSNASLAYPSIAPVVGTQGVGSGGGAKVGVYVTAVDPTSRSVTQGIITGLEEVGIRTR